ncbi:MAG: hypothetical protein B7733_24555 [Myxococcales bacterium FL481]|nr:MAG: hypothetical protein B7733_24555 [Myxococcales bacterium FL481]
MRRNPCLVAWLIGALWICGASASAARRQREPSLPPESASRFERDTTVPITADEDQVVVEPLAAAEPDGASGPDAPLGPWEQIVGEGARLCAAFEAEARTHLLQATTATSSIDDKTWRRRARDCPRGEWVLRAAAQAELRTPFRLAKGSPTPAEVSELERTVRRSRRRALDWLEAIQRERARMGQPLRPRDHYLAARAHAGLGRRDAARAALGRAVRRGGASTAEVQQLSALLAVAAGDLDRAAIASRRALYGGGEADSVVSLYVRALVLDRLGDRTAAARVLVVARNQDRGRAGLLALESVLPVHERLYVRALDRQVEQTRNAALRLWKAYLAHDAPTPGQRKLAEQHRAALAEIPEPIVADAAGRDQQSTEQTNAQDPTSTTGGAQAPESTTAPSQVKPQP